MFIRNCWYVVAWSHEVSLQAPFGRTVLGEPVVLYRDTKGVVAALEDRCCHRGLPLTHGHVLGDTLRCGYHGLEFDRTGACTRVPGQRLIPSGAEVRAFPLAEQDELIWIWMGEPAFANPADIKRFPHTTLPGWTDRPYVSNVRVNYELVHDNLLDLTHVGYVHTQTLGGDVEDHSNARLDVRRTENVVSVSRVMRDTIPGPFHIRQGKFAGRVDRYQLIEFSPGYVIIDSGMVDAGKLNADGTNDSETFNLNKVLFNGITPESEHSTHYFWSMCHQELPDGAEGAARFFDEIKATFDEDTVILEAQYERRRQFPDRTYIDVNTDSAGIQARRIIARRLAAEAAPRSAGVAQDAGRTELVHH